MSTTRKRTADEAWDALDQAAVDDEVKRVLALSDEALDEELADAGLDPAQIRASGASLGAQIDKRAAPTPIRRVRWVAWLAAAALGGVAIVFATTSEFATRREPEHVGQGLPESPERAAHLRSEAKTACDKQSWAQCLELLDRAKAIDPDGDGAQEVQSERRNALGGLHP
jgi:hypothetical protein